MSTAVPPTIVDVVAPRVDEDSAPFWDGTRSHRLLVQRCESCHRRRFPAMPGCPHCGSRGGTWVAAPERGTIYSWVRVHRTANPSFVQSVPYAVATVELEPGCRLVARLEPPEAADIGADVVPFFVDHAEWTEVRFRPATAADGSTGPVKVADA